MIKRYSIIPVLIILFFLPVEAQLKKQELKREVTLYNPYKPSLPEARKRSFLPDMNDTSKVRPDFRYDVKISPFFPEYTISPIKAATLLPDPLPKLYKSYINLGLGNFLTPLAEVSVTNTRSKKSLIGFYGRHFSTNGNVVLDNGKKGFAGYMDNDLSLFGRKYFRKNTFESSMDFNGKTRYAYGYSPYSPDFYMGKKEIRIPYNNVGVNAAFKSVAFDSTEFSYDFRASFDYFSGGKNMWQRKLFVSGIMAKSYEGFYVGSGVKYTHYSFSDYIGTPAEYVFSVNPFIKKSSSQWSFRLGIEALLEKDQTAFTRLHVYPDVNFNLVIVPSYISYFAALSGKLEKNDPYKVISENPYLMPDGTLFRLPGTSQDLVISTGLKGNTGLEGNYLISASYSIVSDMILYSNVFFPDTILVLRRGGFFSALPDDAEILNIHAEMSGKISDKVSFNGTANLYRYSLSKYDHAWNKPNWDGKLGLRYSLRDKIIAGLEVAVKGNRKVVVNGESLLLPPSQIVPNLPYKYDLPAYFNINMSAEYRYSKILSFWTKLNNITNKHYYEWAYYPSQGFIVMLGFTYSL